MTTHPTPTPSPEAVEAAKQCASILAPFNHYADKEAEAAAEFVPIIDRALSAQREAHEREVAKLNESCAQKLTTLTAAAEQAKGALEKAQEHDISAKAAYRIHSALAALSAALEKKEPSP